MSAPERRIVGIDLGTTNTVVAWAEPSRPGARAVFEIPQLVGASEILARPLLPSALYAPPPGEAPPDVWGDAPWVIGELARRRGAEIPGRLVASAKSWLCHAGVDRTAAILPWGAHEEGDGAPCRISPLEASARVLSHVRASWDAAFPSHPLARQDVVLTVPASFDEVARELTVTAARSAGLDVRLLEEPQAAFYDVMHALGRDAIDALAARAGGAALVLVCDVGGGTTDLSLIRVSPGAVERVAVGHHLLLGGDNMDLALAHLCEPRLTGAAAAGGDARLDPARFSQLVLACRAAKERLLGAEPPDDASVTVLGSGARLIGGTLTTRLTRAEVERVILDGFLPATSRSDKPDRRRGGLVAFGLPYERDAAITRHLAWFFERNAPDAPGPHALLLNGGVFNAAGIAQRIVDAIRGWGGPSPEVLPLRDPDLAVARGAVAYGLALRGIGARIAGGAAHGYYVGVEDEGGGRKAICVVPRGAKEGVRHVAATRPLRLTIGRPVRFDLFASEEATVHAPGELVDIDEDGFQTLAPVAASFDAVEPAGGDKAIASPSRAGAQVDVVLEGELSAVGTLDLACIEMARDETRAPRRFRLAFQLRGAAEPERLPSVAPRSRRKLDEASEAILRAFGKGQKDVDPRAAKNLLRELERVLGERGGWTTEITRSLFDALAPNARARKRSADHERVFWSLAGYCLRPGFGHPLDADRVALLAPLLAERVTFGGDVRVWQQFWIAWRRVAGGLDEAQQLTIRDWIDPFLAPPERKLKKPKGPKPEALPDLLEMASHLERAPASRRAELGAWILERTWTDRDPRYWAALGRLGARVPAYASVHHVISGLVAERWLDHLLREKWAEIHTAPRAAVDLARMTGDRARDVSPSTRREVEKRLVALNARDEWIRAVREVVPVEESERATWFGEDLPVGLRLVDG